MRCRTYTGWSRRFSEHYIEAGENSVTAILGCQRGKPTPASGSDIPGDNDGGGGDDDDNGGVGDDDGERKRRENQPRDLKVGQIISPKLQQVCLKFEKVMSIFQK